MTETTQPREQAAIDLDKLQRYDHQGCIMSPDASGDYFLVPDVRDFLATVAAPEAPKTGDKPAKLPWRITDAPRKIVGADGATVANLTVLDLPNAELIVASVNQTAPLVPEVAASEQQVCAPNCFYGDCPPCVAAGLVPAAATTASASGTCPACVEDGGACSNPEECGAVMTAFGRATAPSRNAAPEVKTWQERIVSGAFHPDPLPSGESVMVYTGASAAIAARDAEITELRAALTQQSAAQAPIRQVQQGFPSAWCDVSKAEFDTCTSAKRIVYAAQASHAGADTEREAARYRWLRDKSEPGICAFYLSVGQAFKDVKFTKETVDGAIDAQIAAMSAATEQKEKP